jgi:hypothetical protein
MNSERAEMHLAISRHEFINGMIRSDSTFGCSALALMEQSLDVYRRSQEICDATDGPEKGAHLHGTH